MALLRLKLSKQFFYFYLSLLFCFLSITHVDAENDNATEDLHILQPKELERVSNFDDLNVETLIFLRNDTNPSHYVLVGNVKCEHHVLPSWIITPVENTTLTIDVYNMNLCSKSRLEMSFTLYYDPINTPPNISESTARIGVTRVVQVISAGISIDYLVCSSVSVLCCLFIMSLYLAFPILRRFPSNLIFWRTVVDLIFSVQFLYVNGYILSKKNSEDLCNAGLAFVTQFCLFASLCWYLVLSLNLYFSTSNPFRRPDSKVKFYHTLVWLLSILTGSLTASNYGFRQDFKLCWNRKIIDGLNPLNWGAYFLWTIVFAVISITILITAERKLRHAMMTKTLEMRTEILRQSRFYVSVFSIYWALAAVIWIVVFYTTQGYSIVQDEFLSYFFAVVVGSLGIVDAVVWVFIEWSTLKKVWNEGKGEDEFQFDDISDALRYEFIQRTAEGIVTSTMDQNDDREMEGFKPRRYRLTMEDIETTLFRKTSVLPIGNKPKTYILGGDEGYHFVTYAAGLFVKLRAAFSVSGPEYCKSISGEVELMKKNFSEGASGSFFYYTADERFMIKTLTMDEYFFLLSILERYMEYMITYPKSFLCQFYGLYSITMYGHSEYLVVMNNICRTGDYRLNVKFDLKGSKINRSSKNSKKYKKRKKPNGEAKSPRNKRQSIKFNRNSIRSPTHKDIEQNFEEEVVVKVPTYKDNDLDQKIVLPTPLSADVVKQLIRDAQFLRDCGIMDYSLLLGIHQCTEETCSGKTHASGSASSTTTADVPAESASFPTDPQPTVSPVPSPSATPSHSTVSSHPYNVESPVPSLSQSARGLLSNSDHKQRPMLSRPASLPYDALERTFIHEKHVYHIGIIDMLQRWDWNKRTEQFLKILFKCHCKDYLDISAVEPNWYCERFIRMLGKIFELPKGIGIAELLPTPIPTSDDSNNSSGRGGGSNNGGDIRVRGSKIPNSSTSGGRTGGDRGEEIELDGEEKVVGSASGGGAGGGDGDDDNNNNRNSVPSSRRPSLPSEIIPPQDFPPQNGTGRSNAQLQQIPEAKLLNSDNSIASSNCYLGVPDHHTDPRYISSSISSAASSMSSREERLSTPEGQATTSSAMSSSTTNDPARNGSLVSSASYSTT